MPVKKPWRPDKWGNPYKSGILMSISESVHGEPAYEEGADAMLAALRKMGKRESPGGITVFIPDDVEA